MHCWNTTATPEPHDAAPGASQSSRAPPDHPPQGKTLAWEACGRILDQERADFWEFLACNFLFAVMSLFVLLARSKRLQALQARQLAARIGLVRGGGQAR